MKIIPQLSLFLLPFVFGFSLSGQKLSKPDSLIDRIENASHDTLKISEMLKLAEYYVSQPDEHKKWANKALSLSKEINYKKGIGKSHAALGLYHTYRSSYPEALAQFDSALTIFRNISDKRSEVSVLGNAGNIHAYLGSYQEALSRYLDALEVMEELGDKQWIATANNNIGNIYYFMDDLDNAMKYYQKALKVYRDTEDNQGMALALGNIGIIYNERGNTDQAIINLLEAVNYGKKTNDLAQLGGNYSNLASAYGDKEMYNKALEFYTKAVDIFKELDDKNGLSVAYLSMGEHFVKTGNYEQASDYVKLSLGISRQIKAKDNIMKAYRTAALIDSAQGDYYSAYLYLQKYNQLRDTLFEEDRAKQIAELQTRFDTKAKEKENQLLKEKQAKQEAVIKRKNYLTWFIVSVLLFVGILAYLAFRTSGQQKKANSALSLKNSQISRQKEEIQAQSDNLEKANTEINEKNRQLNQINERMTASLNYAVYIQEAMMPGAYIYERFFREHFIFYAPKEIVSGDFFWLKETNDYLYFAAADCTGHGVPGALVSMLGISYLNEIIAHGPGIETGEVLNQLRQLVKESLERGQRQGRRDGLDIALCRLNRKTLELQYSGAHNPVYVFSSGKFLELTADRMPIGKHRKEKAFASQTLQLSKDDMLYLFSDGITDQFGGKHEEKFKKIRLKALLREVHSKPLSQQKSIIENTYLRWKGSRPQLDDILMLGLKV
jgi:serine phosphatase RsbU (regulator of sigma subunit)